ncbi:hypothetical protein NX059_004016 [Plenodomus lindquistii]|nr:hypothetical protein NX059_004016 [Plenodomus lindquistii]
MHEYPKQLPTLSFLSHAYTLDMPVVMVFDLIIAFTVLTAVILVAFLLYFLLQYLKRRRAQQMTNQEVEQTGQRLETDSISRRLSRRLSQRQMPQQRDLEEQRMTMKTPPLQLLPEIETSDERAVEWLEKGKCKEVRFETLETEHPSKRYHQALDLKCNGDLRWDWSSRQHQRIEGPP